MPERDILQVASVSPLPDIDTAPHALPHLAVQRGPPPLPPPQLVPKRGPLPPLPPPLVREQGPPPATPSSIETSGIPSQHPPIQRGPPPPLPPFTAHSLDSDLPNDSSAAPPVEHDVPSASPHTLAYAIPAVTPLDRHNPWDLRMPGSGPTSTFTLGSDTCHISEVNSNLVRTLEHVRYVRTNISYSDLPDALVAILRGPASES